MGYGPSNLSKIGLRAQGAGPSFWAGIEGPGCCLRPASSLGLVSGMVSLFFSPHQLPPSPCVRNAWARAVILLTSVAISTCLFGVESVKALSPSCVL